MDRPTLDAEVDAFIDAQRTRHLWFVRDGFRPQSDEDRVWLLEQIQRHADRATFAAAAELKRCLSHRSSAASAAS